LAIGWLIGLPEWSGPATIQALATIGFAALLTIVLQGITALFAGVGHGYIAPLAWAVATVAASQVLAVLGWGAWFPWAVPAILAGAGGVAVEPVGPAASRWSCSRPSLASPPPSPGGSVPTKPVEPSTTRR
jgi:ABC-2 type transport system permease protein